MTMNKSLSSKEWFFSLCALAIIVAGLATCTYIYAGDEEKESSYITAEDAEQFIAASEFTPQQIGYQEILFNTCFVNEVNKGKMTQSDMNYLYDHLHAQNHDRAWRLLRIHVVIDCLNLGYRVKP